MQTVNKCRNYYANAPPPLLVTEVSAPRQRSSAGSLFAVPWALGYTTTPGIAYLVRTWTWLQAALTLLLVYVWSAFLAVSVLV